MVLPLIPIVAGFGVLAAGAGLGSLVSGKKDESYAITNTNTTSSVYSPSTQSTYAPVITTTSSENFSPQYIYSPQIAISSPYASQTSKKEQTVAASTSSMATPTITPNLTPTVSPTVSPGVSTSQGGGSSLFGGNEGSLLLVGGAALVAYFLFVKDGDGNN